MQHQNHKILNNHGETIGEMLVSSLIIALAIVMLITMVNISAKLVQKSVNNRKYFFGNINKEETDHPDETLEGKLNLSGDEAGTSLNITDEDVIVGKQKLSGNRYAITYRKATNETN